MDQIVGAIVTPVVDSLMVRVKKHLRYLISCPKYVRDMRTKMEKLKTTRLGVEGDMNYNNSNSLEVPKEVDPWLEKVRMIDTQVETIPIDVGGCFNLKVRHKLGREAFKIIQDIDISMEEKASIKWTNNPITLAQVDSTKASTSSIPFSDYNDFKSRETTYMKAFNALKADSKPHMIALCGMGGVGKTIMTKSLKKVVSEKAMFDFIIEVAIGENMDVSVIQTAVAEQLAIDLKESTKEARVIKLRNGFETKSNHGKKKFLLILDDLWQSVDLKDVGLSPKPDQGIDFKVLLTSRDQNVCIQMGVERDSVLNLEVILDSEAQDFFLQFVKISDDVDLRKIGHDITIRCHGLPIAIKTIACTLNGKSKHVWEDTLSKLEHKNVREVSGEIFAISYKHLHDEETRLTLLLCGLFPEDFDTPTDELVRYAWGLKLLKNVDIIREARNRLNTCIERLIHANLLIQGQEVGCVKMHDLVRAFVLDVCSEDQHSSIVGKWPSKAMSEYCKIISLTCTGIHGFPKNRKYPNLSLLKLMHGDESLRFPEDFYKEMENLEVVAYDKMEYPLHLRSLQCSANLRTLCLHACSLMSDCSSIGNLSNLEVLSFAGSNIHKLPSTIVKLNKLKLLDLTECMYLFIDSGILKSLVKLEELYMISVRRKVNAEGDELVECSKNLHGLEIEFFEEDALPQNMSYKNLKRFRISFGCRLDKNFVRSRYSMENTLMLVNNEYEQPLDSGMNELFEKTQVLYLQVTGIKDFGGGLWASSLQNLRVLHICKCKDLRYLFTIRVANGLKQLEHLKISKCPVLETLVADSDYEISEEKVITFSALKFLSLEWLPMLTSLCKVGNVIELPQLEELILDNLPNFTSIYQHFLKKEAMSTKLKKLDIDNLEKLKEIWPSQLSSNDQVISSQLTVIQVEGCDSLVNLFPSNPMSLLHHLEELTVKYCGSIDVIFNIDLGSSSSSSCVVAEIEEDINSSNLRSIKAWRCWELRQVWKVKGVNDDLPIPGFQNLECIEIRECNRLRNLFTPTTSNFDMKALTKVYINGDHEVNFVAFPPYLMQICRKARNLHTLTISGFTRLEVMFETQQEPISTLFPNLTSITLESCNRIKYLFSPRMAKLLSNLKSIIIGDCHAIEEVVSNIDNEYEEIATSISPHTNTTFFPHLDILHLYHLKSLKRIDGVGANRLTSVTATSIHDKFQCSQVGVAYSSFCQYLRTIYITGCHALLNVIPYHVVGQMSKLEELEISDCKSLKEIFEIEGVNDDVVGDITDIGKGNGDMGSAMTKILRSTNITSLELPNLKVLHIDGCHGLKYIFTSSTLESLKKLQELKIKDCSATQVIVKQEDNGLIIASKDVVFHRLKSLTLVRLPNLKGFFLGKNKLRWPSLDEVEIYGCPQMMIFTSGVSEALNLKYIRTGVGKHNLECGLNFDWTGARHENQQLYNTSMWSTSDITELLQFPWSFSNLIELDVTYGHELRCKETIFPSIDELVKEENVEEAVAADKVVFEGKNNETQSADDNVVILISNKKQVMSMDHPPSSSSCIWKSDWWMASNLSNLTKLSLHNCFYLEHVFSHGMAASLVQLQDLHISLCKNMKVIVEDSESKLAKEVVSFPCLKSLQLTSLKSLKGFCLGSGQAFEWPSLDTLQIIDCEEMRVFTEGESTTPKLKVIETSFGFYEGTEDLNSFIRTKLQEGYKL